MLARNPSMEGTHVVRDRMLGQVLHGARLESVIGEGSAARVYRARHVVLDRVYAIKVLSIPNAQKEDLVERFYREARALSRMAHPNIVGIVDSGATMDGRPFLTMELLRGETLQTRIERLPLRRDEIVRIARQILAGLAEAHRRGLVHRDLKPANVMLVDVGGREVAKLLDFGIARLTGQSAHLTAGEMLLGTPRYMAPEQAMNAADASPRSDLYSLGVVLYEMLSGRAPFEGGLMDVLDKQFNSPPPELKTISGLEPLVFHLLAKDPAGRPGTADEVLDALDRLEMDRAIETISFADRRGVAYVDRTIQDEAETSLELPELELAGPTLLDVTFQDLPFDDSEETMPSGLEPTVRRQRPTAAGESTNLRIFDSEEAETFEALPARPADVDTRDTDPDPDVMTPTRMVEHPMGSAPVVVSYQAARSTWGLMLIALLLAFSVTLVVGAAVQTRVGDLTMNIAP